MNDASPHTLAQRLRQARVAVRDRIVALDPSHVVSPRSGRCVKDIVAHVACWEHEVATSIDAALRGGKYTLTLPIDIDRQNELYFTRMQSMPAGDVIAYWDEQRARLADLVERTESTNDEVTCPWGEAETLTRLVEDMLEHESTHVAQITRAQAMADDA